MYWQGIGKGGGVVITEMRKLFDKFYCFKTVEPLIYHIPIPWPASYLGNINTEISAVPSKLSLWDVRKRGKMITQAGFKCDSL